MTCGKYRIFGVGNVYQKYYLNDKLKEKYKDIIVSMNDTDWIFVCDDLNNYNYEIYTHFEFIEKYDIHIVDKKDIDTLQFLDKKYSYFNHEIQKIINNNFNCNTKTVINKLKLLLNKVN